MSTQWKAIEGYEGIYEVSNDGDIRSVDRIDSEGRNLKGRVLKKQESPNGYLFVQLCTNGVKAGKTVHRLVIEAFKGASDKWVNHMNGLKTDNRLINLEWTTPSENAQHAWDTGLQPRIRPRANSPCNRIQSA